MTPLLTIAAAALSGATPTAAPEPDAMTGTYHAKTGMVCVRSTDLEAAALTGTRIYRRECMTPDQWQVRGIRFVRPVRTAPTTTRS